MRRLEANETWSFFDPVDVRPLTDLVGSAFDIAYESYERDGLARSVVPARTLWETISAALRESGTPFLLFSDNINGMIYSIAVSHHMLTIISQNTTTTAI